MPDTFFLTGSSRGLGRAIADAVLAAGHNLVATARRTEDLAELEAQHPTQVLAVELDVTDYAQAQRALQAGVDRFGRLDTIVNNAGYANLVAIEDIAMDDFRAQLDTNLLGVVHVTKAALPHLRAQGGGHIIQISSIGGRLATASLSAYQSAKWAVAGFSSVLSREVENLNIKVTVLEPGGMQTDWAGSSMQVPPVSEPYRDTVGVMARLHKSDSLALGDPRKVAQVVLDVAAMDEPPLRLILGSEAYAYATAAAVAQSDADARWRAVSISTDRDDATAAARDPLGHAARG